MTSLALAFDLLARDKASSSIDHIGTSAEKTSGKLGGLGGKLSGLGKIAVGAVAGTGVALAGIAAKSANTFASVGGEVLKLQRFTGATAEEASRLRFAAKQSGIDVDTMTRSLGLLSKGLAGTKLDKLGLGLKDASGKALPLNESLLKIAERFQNMPNGAEKTALAMQIFGRSGAQLIPFLNKGAEGLAELEAQSDKFGSTLSGADLDAVKESTKNHRLFSSAMEGLQIQIGRYALPVLTKFTSFLATNAPSAIATVRGAMERLAPTFATVGSIMESVGGAVRQFIGIFLERDFTGGPFAEDSPIIDGAFKIRDAVVDLMGKARQLFTMLFTGDFTGGPFEEDSPLVAGAFKVRQAILDFAATLREKALPVIRNVLGFVADHARPILAGLAAAFLLVTAPVTAVVAGLVLAYTRFQGFRDVIDGAISFITGTAVPAIVQFAEMVNVQFQNLVGFVRGHWDAIQEAIGHVVRAVQEIVGAAVDWISAIWRAWGDDLMNVVGFAWDFISETVKNAIDLVRAIIDTVLSLINGDWGKAWDGVKGILSSVWDQMTNVVSTALNLLGTLIAAAVSALQELWRGAWDKIATVLDAAWDRVLGVFEGFGNFLFTNIVAPLQGILDWFTGLPGTITDLASGMWDGIYTAFKGVVNLIIDGWNSLEFKLPSFGGQKIAGHTVIPAFEGPTLSVPKIDRLHTGGIFDSHRGEGLAILKDGEGVFTPRQMQALGGGRGSQVNTITMVIPGISGESPAQAIVRAGRSVAEMVGGR